MMKNYRPIYHISANKGWINDPNGFVWYQGAYHLYCQHYPYDVKWGPMHWLHFTSTDLIHFDEQGIALKPDHSYDQEFGCFSGSAIEKDGLLYVLYTAASYGRQTQCLAISKDGHHFEKYEGNPVIDEKILPSGYSNADFRDPKLFYRDGRYYVLVSARHREGYSSILLYVSDDLFHYEFVGVIKSFDNCQKGGMVECPDILFEGNKCALLYSLQNPKQEGEKFQSAFTVAYTVGEMDLARGKFTPLGEEHELDRGFDCYATHSLHKDGKNYLVYWMSSWGINYPTSVEGYAGQLSLVKEARIDGEFLKLDFLPNSERRRIRVKLTSEDATLHLNNIVVEIHKKENRIEILRVDMDEPIITEDKRIDEKRYFHLKDVTNLDIEYVYDRSCVEMRFQDGEAFVSLLNLKKDALDEVNVYGEGCMIEASK